MMHGKFRDDIAFCSGQEQIASNHVDKQRDRQTDTDRHTNKQTDKVETDSHKQTLLKTILPRYAIAYAANNRL